ncbi:preprotein translocase subunit SecA [Bartonella sp. DGB1]|uniref:preprotein translocase subunit SecA n=1 Tax=Bartonella sp. DGB1 TaxID=3239807 RepID=UPI00352351F4
MVKVLNFIRKIFGSNNKRKLNVLYPIVDKINALEPEFVALSDKELQDKTREFKDRLSKGEKLDSLIPEVFACVRETSKRVLGLRHFDVQLLGGLVLHRRGIAEMRTGEGKTLMATLPIYLNALEGKGVHIVTVNDYLAQRDSETLRPLFDFLGMTTGVILNDMNQEERKRAYNCDITYATNNELGFDFLRDNMAFDREQMVQREHNYAIIDEVDSILIDEARTPLIISGPLEDKTEFYDLIDKFVLKLSAEDYEIDEKNKNVVFTEVGVEKIEKLLAQEGHLKSENLYDIENVSIVHHLNNSLKAHNLFQRDKDYIVRDNKVIIIDEFTGRMMTGRRYGDGLHQAIEAKEHVTIQPETHTLSQITFQNYFRMYKKLAGMTGTALTEAEEFANIYDLEVVEIPTNLPICRIDDEDEIYRTEVEKYNAIVKEIQSAHAKKQPILIGTNSIEKSERMAKMLKNIGIKKFQVLNARYHEQEAEIIAQAGVPGSITIATNMAGRGTDIQLGGNLSMRISKETANMQDGPAKNLKIEHIKQEVEQLKKEALQAGGLYVIGTERHESRRIDNQLRGRSGRQGDPGRSKFYLSLEDDLMRIFGSNRMQAILNKLGLKEGEAIIHPWISKALEKAQTKVEAHYFDARKNLLKYDDVSNDQRKVIFEQRLEVMNANNLNEHIEELSLEVIDDIVAKAIPAGSYKEKWNLEQLKDEALKIFKVVLPIEKWNEEEGLTEEEITNRIETIVLANQNIQREQLGEKMSLYIQRAILLEAIDEVWRAHLTDLDHLRSVIGFRGYGQRDPLIEYKMEAFELFNSMFSQLRKNAMTKLSNLQMATPNKINSIQTPFTSRSVALPESVLAPSIEMVDEKLTEETARNSKCSCGSGKKYKHCHGKF